MALHNDAPLTDNKPLQCATVAVTPDTQGPETRARENIRLLKTQRRMSDQNIADLAGYASRQMVADRINGRTPLNLSDIDRIAKALDVTWNVLLGPASEMLAWVDENPVRPTSSSRKRRTARA